ncbi:phosphonate ABC transporter substrate-binding protein [Caldovatus sediminis]|uniref:Phosphonate ABC transporter substrate-binding protein n=1 Tax=Caldovatus sediminis TaxID=2041189 RepID=A0A8J3EDR8_9PROT|nr:phosphate/phosphite/phosphonate ABC transporter substrate-binding protein [Caldovatus sediminis]GGG45328.1 phosphonate ABC transporter substrate-binding protein [Caldovatus sediminis]
MSLPRRRLFRALTAACAAALLPAGARAQRRSTDPDIAFPAPGRREWAAQVPQLRVGVLGGENEADRLGRFGPYRELLERTFQIPVRLFMASDYAGVIQAFGAGQLEISTMSPAAYAAAWLDTNGGVEPILCTEEADGSISYVAVMVVRADSGIASLEQMRGRSIVWSDPNSASGYLIPRFALRRQGINPDRYFSRTGFGGGHEQAIVAVLQRQYDAAVTWASGIGEEAEGFTRGALRSMVEKGMINMRDLRVIWRSEPIINGPTTVRADLPASFKEDMKLFHLALPRAHPEIYRQIERGGGAGYREVTHAQYQFMVDLRREEAQERRRRN